MVDVSEMTQAYKIELAKNVVKGIFDMATIERETNGDKFANEFLLSIMSSIAASLVYDALKTPRESGLSKLPPYVEMKLAIENAVGHAFMGAFQNMAATPLPDFVCQVTRVGPSPSKVAN